jgi:CHAP domain/Putative peptidoglycan binding domain
MSEPIFTYPGTPLTKKSGQTNDIKAVQGVLTSLGLGQGLTSGIFDAAMESAVCLFQSRNVDLSGHALKVDGVVGSFTWTALFGAPLVATATNPIAVLPAQALSMAISQIGVMENKGEPNRGPEVDAYLTEAGIKNPAVNAKNGGYPWCQAFVYWCIVQSCKSLARANPAPKTAGVLDHWNQAKTVSGVQRITKPQALAGAGQVQSGMVFVNDYGNGYGHIGFVERVFPDGRLITVEGNTNPEANREGLGVFRLERRKITDKELKGFLDYSAA